MKIKELRKAANLNQVMLAERMGVTQSTVSSWETGSAMPAASTLPKLADLLGCTIDDLYGRSRESA
jgi:Predicted transcriptional regulators